jgi:opacity protein-like surface antigen
LYYSGKGEYSNVSTSAFSTTESKDSYDVTGYSIALKPGIQYFLSNRVAIDVSVDILKYSEQKETYTTRTDNFSEFEVNLIPNSLTLGISYRFGGIAAQ